ncbi:MAG: OmpA family protein, partial [Bacteroidota bacterium]
VPNWLAIADTLDGLEQELNLASLKKIKKLKKYDITRHDIRKSKENLQNRIFEKMVTAVTMGELDTLENYAGEDYWSDIRVDTIRRVVINRTLNPEQEVFGEGADENWISRPLELPSLSDLMMEKGRSCADLRYTLKYNVSYDEATNILHNYADLVLPQNYRQLWTVKSNIWDIFQAHRPYCEMDSFKVVHPYANVVQDCWYDEASVALCEYDLSGLLKFHKEHPHTALDLEVAQRILCLAASASELDEAQKEQLAGIVSMFQLRQQLSTCSVSSNVEEVLEQLIQLANEYEGHKMVFDLVARTIDYYIREQEYEDAQIIVRQLRPLFKDVEVCTPSYFFQDRKQAFFDQYERLLERAQREKDSQNLMPVTVWNTIEHDEYGLVSWGETAEVFFVRKNRETKEAQLMTSIKKATGWTKPIAVSKLSIGEDVEPLSVSGDGRMMLLKSKGKLFQSYRKLVGRSWSTPEWLPMPSRFVENAWISPDDSLMLLEYYDATSTAFEEPGIHLATAELMPNGAYGKLKMMKEDASFLTADEARPVMALDGRILFYVSSPVGAWGSDDMYSVRLKNPYAWEQMDEPLNIGLPMNTLFADYGVTYLSEYTGHAYFHKKDRCGTNRSLDIWQFEMGKEIYPQEILRLAGIVLDEKDRPIGASEGFMEFTPDYQLHVHYEPISSKGTYSYTVQDSTTVVRLFPEVPGYYSEQETKHFLADAQQGEIIRDTFRLTSFDYIRKYFKLIDCTFDHDQAIFDQPNKTKPELNRLAKIATRMGANLELVGHTDQVGTAAKNKQLSLDRAKAVKDFLVNSCGFPAERIEIEGKGASEPICDNDTEEGRRCNRRVEVKFEMPELKVDPMKLKKGKMAASRN